MQTRQGFTLVELLVSLTLLTVGVLGLQMATARLVRVAATADRKALAGQVAEDRLELIRTDPNYGALTVRYVEAGTAVPVPQGPGFTRTTQLAHTRDSTQAGITDYTRITVTVDGPGLPVPVARTISVGRP